MNKELPWYKEGVRFTCTECGKCCTGPSGFVWVTEEEMLAMAAFLGIALDLFKRKYMRRKDNRYALVEKKNQNNEFDCIFLKAKKCQIYQARPKQCRTYPFWRENLTSEESWESASNYCEGIHDDASLIPYSQILQFLTGSDNQGDALPHNSSL